MLLAALLNIQLNNGLLNIQLNNGLLNMQLNNGLLLIMANVIYYLITVIYTIQYNDLLNILLNNGLLNILLNNGLLNILFDNSQVNILFNNCFLNILFNNCFLNILFNNGLLDKYTLSRPCLNKKSVPSLSIHTACSLILLVKIIKSRTKNKNLCPNSASIEEKDEGLCQEYAFWPSTSLTQIFPKSFRKMEINSGKSLGPGFPRAAKYRICRQTQNCM